VIIFNRTFPESPRWLLSQDKSVEANAVIRHIAASNNMPHPSISIPSSSLNHGQPPTFNYFGVESAKSGNKGSKSILDLFRTPNLRKKTVILFYIWFVNAFVYYGLSLNSANIGGDVFVNFIVGGLVEIPAYGFSIYIVIKLGRKLPLCIVMIGGGIACLLTISIKKGDYEYDWPIIALAMTGKFGISASFAIIYVYSAEIFPTVVRNIGVGASSMFARAGSVVAPFVKLLVSLKFTTINTKF
jgi:OCT family organic cation transporter-like MFS transporter 4/5